MAMDTAGVDLVNSALQSTNEASRHEASSLKKKRFSKVPWRTGTAVQVVHRVGVGKP